MNLGQYKDSFEKEQICGAVLCGIDDSVLDIVLDVTSELHRAKIMELVTGAVSYMAYGLDVH